MGSAKRFIEDDLYSNRAAWGKRDYFDRYRPLDISIHTQSYTEQYERQQNVDAVNTFNSKIMAWGEKVRGELLLSIKKKIKEDRILSDSLKVNYRHWGRKVQSGKEITSIGFSFVVEGIYVHLGVGRGYNMEGGTRVLTKKSDRVWRREPKEWFNPVIQANMKDLENIIKDYCGKLGIDTTRIYINV